MSDRRRCLVTGASAGIGFAIARALARDGNNVAICARNTQSLEAAAAGLREEFPEAHILGHIADVSREADVDAFFDRVIGEFGGLDTVVANAGIYGPKGPIEDVSWDEWCDTIRINLLGAAYCVRRSIPTLRESSRGKIIILSGGGATKPMPFISGYAASKAGIVRFGESIAEELRPAGIDVNMIAPGAVNTRMLDEILAAGPQIVGEAYYRSSVAQRESGGSPPELGASLCVFLASRRSDGITGKLISAQWDPWSRFEGEAERLSSDVYTLRRIIPEDRGWSW